MSARRCVTYTDPAIVLWHLHRTIVQLGSQQAVATAAGISKSRITEVLQGQREPNDALLAAIGLERCYRRRQPETPHATANQPNRGEEAEPA